MNEPSSAHKDMALNHQLMIIESSLSKKVVNNFENDEMRIKMLMLRFSKFINLEIREDIIYLLHESTFNCCYSSRLVFCMLYTYGATLSWELVMTSTYLMVVVNMCHMHSVCIMTSWLWCIIMVVFV